MKNITIIIAFTLLLPLFSCEDGLEVWNTDTSCIHFTEIDPDDKLETPINNSFIFLDQEIMRDTVYLKVCCTGLTKNYERRVNLRQVVVEGVDNAQPNVHYLPFDTEGLQDRYVIGKDSVWAMIPIVLLRDRSLTEKQYTLRVELVGSDDFETGVASRLTRTITVSDYLSKPRSWMDRYFGAYSQVKHRFMIVSSFGQKFDEDFFATELAGDRYLCIYYMDYFREKLAEYNSDPQNNDTPLRSEPTADEPEGHIISFPKQ